MLTDGKVTDKDIRNRFILCINEIGETLEEIAGKIGTHKAYLSALKKTPTPKVPATLIAKLCLEYGISPYYVILGTGPRRSKESPKTKDQREIERLKNQIDKLIELIGDCLNEMLVLKAVWTDKTRQIAQDAKKNVQ